MKRAVILIAAGVALLWAAEAKAADPPHSSPVSCASCHKAHKAPGPSLTAALNNVNLCLSCHYPNAGGPPKAGAKPFSDSMQAKPGQVGISHAWNGAMPATSSPDNDYGLRAAADISNSALRARLLKYGGTVVCSVCHNEHAQSREPWDPNSSATYTAGVTGDRHFMLIANPRDILCEECHYYRAMSYTKAKGEDPAYVANGTNVFSHPVGEILNSQGYDYYKPLDANGVSQGGTAPRYAGDMDGNPTNNIVLDNSAASGPGAIRCQSCHRVHWVDSNALTNDVGQ